MAMFDGKAALGAFKTRGGFTVYTCDRFGFDEAYGYFTASFSSYEAQAPMTAEEAADKVRERCEDLVYTLDSPEVLDLCEEYDCSPSAVGERCFETVMYDAEDDPFAAYAAEFDTLPFDEGEVALLAAGGGQHDRFGELERYFADESVVADIKALWGEWHLKRDIPDEVMEQASRIISALESSPSPEDAAAAYFADNPDCFSGTGR